MRKRLIFIIALVIPLVLVFRYLFYGSLTWGDAPHFYFQEFGELLNFEPSAWITRGENFGAVDPRIWIFPLLSVIGLLGSAGLSSNVVVLLVFYLPAILFSVIGPVVLVRYLKMKRAVQFFAALVYSLNTYFLLVVDGGQVGFALAYGLFPLGICAFLRLIDRPSKTTYLGALIVGMFLSVSDPRVLAISILVVVLWRVVEKKVGGLAHLGYLVVALVGLNAYWIIALIRIGTTSAGLSVSGLTLVELIHPLTLFSPHWPENIFGVVGAVPFYFYIVALVVVLGALIGKKYKLLVLFLFFAFLAKGGSAPFGGLYNLLVSLPFGFAFRDSTKFFMPVILFAGILIGKFTERDKLKAAAVYLYLLFLVYPAILGNLNFVLSNRLHFGNVETIERRLENVGGFYRVAWFPERHPLSFHTKDKQALDAKGLVSLRPLANLNTGNFDVFNFLHNEEYLDWFRILGIRYLVLSGNPRVVQFTDEQTDRWKDLKELVENDKNLVRQDWSDIPVYEVLGTRPNIYSTEKVLGVVGGSVGSFPAVYFEDGVFDPRSLEGKDADSVSIVFNGKNKTDLTMSFLQEYFVGVDEAVVNEWASYETKDYLSWKYQLLIREVETNEFDFGEGIAFSTVQGEKLRFEFNVDDGDYVEAVRKMEEGVFKWETRGVNVVDGHVIEIENNQDISVVNVVALIPVEEWNEANRLADVFTQHFGVVEVEDIGEEEWSEIEYERYSSLGYKVTSPEKGNWIVFTDNYHPKWVMMQGTLPHDSIPIYSQFNSFYVEPEWTKLSMEFEGQRDVRWGMYWSVVSALVIAIVFLLKPAKG